MGFASSLGPSTLSFSPSVKFVNNNAYNLGGHSWSCFRFYNIPEGITNGALMFESCSGLNHNVKLPSTLQNACNLFTHCYNLNQKNLKFQFNNIANAAYMCCYCSNLPNLTQPVIFDGNQNKDLHSAFYGCHNFNCPYIYLGDNVYNAYAMFYRCNNLNCPVTLGNNCNFNGYGNFNLFGYYLPNFNSLITIGDYFTCTYDSIAYNVLNFNTDIVIGNYANYIYGVSYRCPNKRVANITIGHNCNTLKNVSVYEYNYLDGTIKVGNDINYIENFLIACYNYNGNIILGNNINYIKNFLIDCSNYNKPLYFNNTKSINYLVRYGNFNQPVYMTGTKFVDNLFFSCNFNYNIVFPETIQGNFNNIFVYCYIFNQNIKIPNNILAMERTFAYCDNFNQNIQIPNSVQTIYSCFDSCSNFNQNISMFNNIKNMSSAFRYCINLNQNIKIPNDVEDISYSFYGCNNLNQNISLLINSNFLNANFAFASSGVYAAYISINNSVSYFDNTYYDCSRLKKCIIFNSYNIECLNYTFRDCYNIETLDILNSNINIFSRPFYISNNQFSFSNNLKSINLDNTIINTMNDLFLNYPFANYNNILKCYNNTIIHEACGTFQNAYNLNQKINFVNYNVDGLFENTFENCRNLNCLAILPENAISLAGTYKNCGNLNMSNQFYKISDKTLNIANMFYGTKAIGRTNIDEGVFGASRNSINANIQLGKNITNMSYAFYECTWLDIYNNYIPKNVIDMSYAFAHTHLFRSFNLINVSIYPTDWGIPQYTWHYEFRVPKKVENLAGTFKYACSDPISVLYCLDWQPARGHGNGCFTNIIFEGNNITNMDCAFEGFVNWKAAGGGAPELYWNRGHELRISHIPNSVISMNKTFFNCFVNFERILIGNKPIQIPESVLYMESTYAIDSSISYASLMTYNTNYNLIGPNVLTIYGFMSGHSGFKGNALNNNFIIPDSVINASYAFASLEQFKANVTMSKNIQNLAYAFYNSYWINTSDTNWRLVSAQGNFYFNDLYNLTNIESCFNYCGIYEVNFANCNKLSYINNCFTKGIQIVNFSNCKRLYSSINNINCISWINSIHNLDLSGAGVYALGNYYISSLPNLEEINLDNIQFNSVYGSNNIFVNCRNLKKVSLNNIREASRYRIVYNFVFNNCPNLNCDLEDLYVYNTYRCFTNCQNFNGNVNFTYPSINNFSYVFYIGTNNFKGNVYIVSNYVNNVYRPFYNYKKRINVFCHKGTRTYNSFINGTYVTNVWLYDINTGDLLHAGTGGAS